MSFIFIVSNIISLNYQQTASVPSRAKHFTPEPQQSSVPNRFPSLHSPLQGKHVGAGKNIPKNPLKKHATNNESPY
jgi:hypothetical protein